MTLVDANGYFSFLMNVAGNFMLTHKSRHGWLVRIVAIVSWGIYGIQLSSKPVMANAVTFFCVNCYGWWKWSRDP